MTAKAISRALVYAVLVLAALFFLAPLYVMLATSFKDGEQIRSGSLLALPASLAEEIVADVGSALRQHNLGALLTTSTLRSAVRTLLADAAPDLAIVPVTRPD